MSDKKYWAKGTGYGTPDDDRSGGGWNIAAQTRKQEQLAAQLLALLRGIFYFSLKIFAGQVLTDVLGLIAFLAPLPTVLAELPPPFLAKLHQALEQSALIPLMESYFRYFLQIHIVIESIMAFPVS